MSENESQLMWAPQLEKQRSSLMAKFRDTIRKKYDLKLEDYADLHQWSVEEKEVFWSELIEFFDVKYEGTASPAFTAQGFEAYGWFPHLKLNLAENLLRERKEDKETLVFLHESRERVSYSYQELTQSVAAFQHAIKETIQEGDVLAAYMPNLPETLIAMLATSAQGGVFTSTSCDFGVNGVVDRFGQCAPKVLIAAASYQYNGKLIDNMENIREIEKKLPSLEKVIIVDFLSTSPCLEGMKKALSFEEMMKKAYDESDLKIHYHRISFDSPAYIMYSSGTTGKPKCIVHGVGGVLLQHIKEHGLHVDLGEKDNILYFTTCGWMMWNWLVSALYFKGVTTLYEGSPACPTLLDFMQMIKNEKITVFGTSPKFLKALESTQAKLPRFPKLRTILSTGSPLLEDQFDYVYTKIKKTVQLSSISGGTDILGCFMLGCPITGVYRGEIQALGLGMDVACFNEQGEAVVDQEGELVCRQSFPSRPLKFLGDDENNSKLKAAYFERFPGVWHHGDFMTLTERKTVKIFGRSDATLNPGGVRIGTAEIYSQTEQLDYIDDSLCVGRPKDGDVEVILFVKMQYNEELTQERKDEIKALIKEQTTPRHVPRFIYAVKDIPYTRSGKKMELPVTRILAGKKLENREAVANPECLDEYSQWAQNN